MNHPRKLEDDFQHWRCVDVEGEDGLIRRGIVTDTNAQRGLTVDFGYPGHRQDVIQINKCWHRERDSNHQPGNAVEVLHRLSPDGPWCWLPSMVLVASSSYAFVATELGGRTVQDIVPSERISCLPVQRRPYVCCEHVVELPSDHILLIMTDRKDVFQFWSMLTGTAGITLQDKKLTFLGPTFCDFVTKLQFDLDLLDIRENWTFTDADPPMCHLENLKKDSREIPDALGTSLPCINRVLPGEIVLHMFSFLGLDDQIKCRRVCQKWNDLAKLSRRVEINLSKYSCLEAEKVALTVHKMVTCNTRTLILTGRDLSDIMPSVYFKDFLCTVIEMLKAKNITVPVLVISHKTICGDDILDYSDPFQLRLRAKWIDACEVCDKLILEQVTLRDLFEAQDEQNLVNQTYLDELDYDECPRSYSRYFTDEYGVVLDIVNGAIDTKEQAKVVSVLNILEEVCPEPESVPDAVRFVKENLMEICLEDSPMWRESVFEVLRKWQPDDSRFCSNAGWKQDHLAGIALESLRNLTVLALRYHLGKRERGRRRGGQSSDQAGSVA